MVADRYRLEAVIGRGAMGAVWRAHDELLDRDVAVKEIIWPPEFSQADRDVARSRAFREAQLAARLRHPNVVGVYDIVEEDGRPCIVMELVPFRSLRDAVIEDGPMTPSQAARVGLAVLAALHAVHETGVVHRDVKPSNILLSPEGRVVLTDFGIAKAADSSALTSSGVLMGSPSFLAPERARGEPAGTAADLWALGALLYTAVEGRPPFEREDALSSLTAVVADELDPPAEAGPLRPVIEGLLRKDPADRLDAVGAEELLARAAAWDTSADEEDSADRDDSADRGDSATSPPTTADAVPAATAGRQRRWTTIALVALVVALLAATVIGLILPGRGARGGHAAPASSLATSASAAAPSSSAPATTAPATTAPATTLPAGYYRFSNSSGFSIGVPRTWQVSYVGQDVYFRDPADSGIFLLIDQSDQPKANPLADWEQQAASRASGYPDYHLIRIQAVPYAQAIKAADWEFTYDRGGVQVHVLNRNILANSHHAYALYWSTPVSDWNADYHYFETFAGTFRPAP